MAHFSRAWFDQSSDEVVTNTPAWRDYAFRLAHDALRHADSGKEYVKEAWHRLMVLSKSVSDAEAVPVFRRLIRLMDAFAAMPQQDRDALIGRLPHDDTWMKNGDQVRELLTQRQQEAWNRSGELATYRAELDAAASSAAEAGQRQHEAYAAAQQASQQAMRDAPGILAGMMARGVRIDVQGNRARAWPASHLTDDKRTFLEQRNAETVGALQADWTA